MIQRKSQTERKHGRGKEKKRVTVRAIYKAIKKYPSSAGASVRDICRNINKDEPEGKARRSLSSVKMAISRAVRTGSIRAPKGWHGFRGIDASNNRHGRKPSKGKRGAGRRASKGPSSPKSPARRQSATKGGKSKTKKGPGNKSGGRRGRPPGKGNKHSNTNSSHANKSGNYNTNESGEQDTASVWYTSCAIS